MKIARDVDCVSDRIQESIEVKNALLRDEAFLNTMVNVAEVMTTSLNSGGTIFFFGNGGSAADAQHMAAELAGKFLMERRPLAGIALTTNSSSITAIANDYGYDSVFSRQLVATGKRGDVAVGISTSGNAKNVLRAMDIAEAEGIVRVGMTGRRGGTLASAVDHCLCVDSDQTPRIQEAHIMIGHILCEIVEERLCNGGNFSRS